MKRPPFVLQKGIAIGLQKCCFDNGGGKRFETKWAIWRVSACSKYIFTRLLVSITYSSCIFCFANSFPRELNLNPIQNQSIGDMANFVSESLPYPITH